MKIVFATANAGKLREAAEVLGPDFEIISLAQAGITEDIPETGSTLQENSLQKARYLFAALVAFFTTRPVAEVFDFVFLPVTLSLT